MTDRFTELQEKIMAGVATDEEKQELVEMINELSAQMPKHVRRSAEELAALFPAGNTELSNEENVVIDELDYHIQECFRIARAKAPAMPIAQVLSTMLVQMYCVVTPASKYNGIDYAEYYKGYGEGDNILPDFGLSQMALQLVNEFEDPEGYDKGHLLKPVSEHDFQYELDPARRANHLYEAVREHIQEIATPEWFQDPLITDPVDALYHDFRESCLDDGMLRDLIADTFNELFPEPDADAENPAGR